MSVTCVPPIVSPMITTVPLSWFLPGFPNLGHRVVALRYREVQLIGLGNLPEPKTSEAAERVEDAQVGRGEGGRGGTSSSSRLWLSGLPTGSPTSSRVSPATPAADSRLRTCSGAGFVDAGDEHQTEVSSPSAPSQPRL